MTIERIRQFEFPFQIEDLPRVQQYLEYLHKALQEETVQRIEDIENELSLHLNTIYHVPKTTVGASAYAAADQENLTDATLTKVTLGTEEYDLGSNFATSRFTAPVAGKYHVSGQVRFKNIIANKRYAACIYEGGDTEEAMSVIPSVDDTNPIAVPVSKTITLAVDEYVELYAAVHCGAATVDIAGGNKEDTFMSVHLVSV
jgi:hypothetical protein